MQTVTKIRQRRNVVAQMQSHTDFEGNPCLQIFENTRIQDVIFGPYITGCSQANGGCYDVQMTTRSILPLEYSACMIAATSSALFQGGSEYNNEVGIPNNAGNLCEGNITNAYRFNQPETPTPPETTWAVALTSTLAFSGYIDVEGQAYVLWNGSSNDNEDNGIWDELLLNTSVEEETAFQAAAIVGVDNATQPRFVVLSTDNYLYNVALTSSGTLAQNWVVSGISWQQVRFMNGSNDYQCHATLVFEATPTVLRRLSSLGGEPENVFTHPSGLDWLDASTDNGSIIAIDVEGGVYIYGDNTWGQLGLDPDVEGTWISTLTELDTSSMFGQPVKVYVSNKTVPASFIFTDRDNVYSSGRYGLSAYPKSLLGRSGSGTTGWSLFRRMPQKFSEISVGDDVGIAIHIDGTLWGWGKTNYCALGIEELADTDGYTASQTEVAITLSFNTSWKSIAARYAGVNVINGCSSFINRSYVASNMLMGQKYANDDFSLADYYRTEFSKILIGYKATIYVDTDGNVYGAGTPSTYVFGSIWTNTVSEITYFPEFGIVSNMWVFGNTWGSAYVDSNGDFYVTGSGIPRIDSPGVSDYGYDDYTLIPFDSEVVQAVCNTHGMMVRLANNQVWSWGMNRYFCLAYNGDEFGDPNDPSWVDVPTKINGEYNDISLGYYHGAGISILGGLVMWGADIQDDLFGLFGQGTGDAADRYAIKDNYTDPQSRPTLQVEYPLPTAVSLSDEFVSGPTIFSKVVCFYYGTFVLNNENDEDFVVDGYKVNGPRWCSGDVWGTGWGLENMLFEYTEGWKYGGVWRPVLYSCWESFTTSTYLLEFEEFAEDYFNVGGTPDPLRIDSIVAFNSGNNYIQHDVPLLRKCPYALHEAHCASSDENIYSVQLSPTYDFEFAHVWYVLDDGSDEPISYTVSSSTIEITPGVSCSLTVYYVLKYTEANPPDSAYYRVSIDD